MGLLHLSVRFCASAFFEEFAQHIAVLAKLFAFRLHHGAEVHALLQILLCTLNHPAQYTVTLSKQFAFKARVLFVRFELTAER